MAARDNVAPITSVIAPDLGAVRGFITEMLAKGAVVALVASIIALLTRMRDLNTELLGKLAHRSRQRPPNETMRRLQLELPLILTSAGDVMPFLPEKKPRKKRGPKTRHPHGRPQLPPHLERIPEKRCVPESERICPTCASQVKTIAYKTTEKLDIIPAQFVVRQMQYETVGCPTCHCYIRTAPREDAVLDRGILGNELLIQALTDHYDDAVPWERMETNARQQGVPLAANTLASSVGRVIDLFDPVVAHIRKACFSSHFTALDATRMPLLDPEHPLGIRSASLWLIEGEHRYACFLYAPSGHADHLQRALEGASLRSVMCDGSATNNCVERTGGRRGGCNAHGRRKLAEALRGGDTRAVDGIRIYGEIFHVEAESKRFGETIDQRFARRQRDSAPLVESLRAWIDLRRRDVEPKSVLGKAVGYLHRQWNRLTAFLQDPLMELTNNEVERDLRRWVLDRKTWMFVGHETSARRAADALTLITTCKKFNINPRSYLRDTLAKILAGEKHLTALLPESYARSQLALLSEQVA
jgi:transposase